MDEKFKVNFFFENDDRDNAPELTEEHLIGDVAMQDGRTVKLYQTEKAYHIPETRHQEGAQRHPHRQVASSTTTSPWSR